MNKRRLRIWAVGILLVSLIGCGQVSQKDYDALKVENESLKKELDELRFGADRLLGDAKNYIENTADALISQVFL
jgi:cell division protein FtsB